MSSAVIILRPLAPALAQSAASSLVLEISMATQRWAPSKAHSLCCFKISHGVRRAIEARPGCRVVFLACIHQSEREMLRSGGRHVIRNHDRISYQNWREKGQPVSRWLMVSGS
jgi:hypothetical protein